MLSEISQIEKGKYRMILLIWGASKINNLIDTEKRLVAARGEGW